MSFLFRGVMAGPYAARRLNDVAEKSPVSCSPTSGGKIETPTEREERSPQCDPVTMRDNKAEFPGLSRAGPPLS